MLLSACFMMGSLKRLTRNILQSWSGFSSGHSCPKLCCQNAVEDIGLSRSLWGSAGVSVSGVVGGRVGGGSGGGRCVGGSVGARGPC